MNMHVDMISPVQSISFSSQVRLCEEISFKWRVKFTCGSSLWTARLCEDGLEPLRVKKRFRAQINFWVFKVTSSLGRDVFTVNGKLWWYGRWVLYVQIVGKHLFVTNYIFHVRRTSILVQQKSRFGNTRLLCTMTRYIFKELNAVHR